MEIWLKILVYVVFFSVIVCIFHNDKVDFDEYYNWKKAEKINYSNNGGIIVNNQTITELQERVKELENKIEDYRVALNMYKRNYRESMKITEKYQKKYDDLVREYNR